jgi:hypothetical protein
VTDGDESDAFNSVLADASIAAFGNFNSQCDHQGVERADVQHRNHLFFEHQRLRAYQFAIPDIAALPELARLETHITTAALETLKESGVHSDITRAVEIGALSVDIWTVKYFSPLPLSLRAPRACHILPATSLSFLVRIPLANSV